MRLVIDANVLFSFFWKGSTTRMLIDRLALDLIAPEYALDELQKYASLIRKKSKITVQEWRDEVRLMQEVVAFMPVEFYSSKLAKARTLCPDPDDVDYIALAMKLKCPVWSNDIKLKQQIAVQVFNTSEIMQLRV